jgi:hypothetical protein
MTRTKVKKETEKFAAAVTKLCGVLRKPLAKPHVFTECPSMYERMARSSPRNKSQSGDGITVDSEDIEGWLADISIFREFPKGESFSPEETGYCWNCSADRDRFAKRS